MGRPPRELPEGIGILPDDAVAYLAEQRGEPMTRQAVRQLRERRGIPPATEPWRARWLAEREPGEDWLARLEHLPG